METTKKISIRCPQERYIKFKERAEKLNMNHSEYLNILIENDLRDNGIVLNQKEIIRGMCRISTHINHLAENYPKDEEVKAIKEEVRLTWRIF